MNDRSYLYDVHDRAREEPDEGSFFCVECGAPCDEDEELCDECWPHADDDENDELRAHVAHRLWTLTLYLRRGRKP